jgi:hypothetical protein
MIILTRDTKKGEEYISHVDLDETSDIKNLENTKYYSNIFSIIGKNTTITVMASTLE